MVRASTASTSEPRNAVVMAGAAAVQFIMATPVEWRCGLRYKITAMAAEIKIGALGLR
jgi:hypothetical protein